MSEVAIGAWDISGMSQYVVQNVKNANTAGFPLVDVYVNMPYNTFVNSFYSDIEYLFNQLPTSNPGVLWIMVVAC